MSESPKSKNRENKITPPNQRNKREQIVFENNYYQVKHINELPKTIR